MSQILLIAISKSLYLDNVSVNFAEVLPSDGTAISVSIPLLSFLSLTTMSGLCPCRCAQAYPRALQPHFSHLLLLAGVYTTSQFSRLHNLCRSFNKRMPLSCYADICTLFLLILGTPRQCDQWTLQIFRRSCSEGQLHL